MGNEVIGFRVMLFTSTMQPEFDADYYEEVGEFTVFRSYGDNSADPPRAKIRTTSIIGIITIYGEGSIDTDKDDKELPF